MWRLKLFITLVATLFLGLVAVFCEATQVEAYDSLTRCWLLVGMLLLLSQAYDLSLLICQLLISLGFARPKGNGVPLVLDDKHRALLEESSPSTAVIIPAHREATTLVDRVNFSKRLIQIIQNSPNWCDVWLLFDSAFEQAENEYEVVAQAKKKLTSGECKRLRIAEYRSKPTSHRNKPGSIEFWLSDHPEIEYVFVLDADSTIQATADMYQKESTHVIERSVLAMISNAQIGMIQGALVINRFSTLWGWCQHVGTKLGVGYGRLIESLYCSQSPCYGHGVLWKASVLKQVCTTSYLSHDHIESATAAQLGHECVFSANLVTFESAEDSFLGFSARSHRWGRGNIQWLHPLLTYWQMPIGPRLYMSVGIWMYLCPLIATLFVLLSACLVQRGEVLFSTFEQSHAALLFLTTGVSLLGLRLIFNHSPLEALGMICISALMSPAQMVIDAVIFLTSPFGSGWTSRLARDTKFGLGSLPSLVKLCLPASLLSSIMYYSLCDTIPNGWGEQVLFAVVALLLTAPVLSILVTLIKVPSVCLKSEDLALVEHGEL